MRHIVDIETWERRDNYNFFRGFVNSWYSITTEIDCTEASAAARASGHSFFLYYRHPKRYVTDQPLQPFTTGRGNKRVR